MEPVTEKIQAGTTMADAVVDSVRKAIMTGRMSPDSLYSVNQLATQLGVSRSPTREGLLRLEEAGAIEFVRNRGFRIIPITPADIVEIFAIRVALEVPAARRAASDPGSSAQALERARSAMAAAADAGDEGSFSGLDEDLHAVILQASGSTRALDVVQRLRETARLLGVASTRSDLTMQQVFHHHEEIVDAIIGGDVELAGRLMQDHLVNTGRIVIRRLMEGLEEPGDPDELWEKLTSGYHFTGASTFTT